MGDVGYRSMHQGISHRFFFSIALDFAENEPIWYLSSGYYIVAAAEINNPLWGVLGLARHHQRPSAPAALGPKKPTSGEFVYAPVQFPPPMRSLHGVVKSSKTEKRIRI